jgi:hypothetical protein
MGVYVRGVLLESGSWFLLFAGFAALKCSRPMDTILSVENV